VQGGDLSNDPQPCLIVVFEGLLGTPPPRPVQKRRWGRTKSPRAQIAEFTINAQLLGKIRSTPYPVEVVTFFGPDFAQAIADRLDTYHALVRRVWSTTPEDLAKIHLTMPDVARIYDPDPRRAFATYGSLGRHLMPENAPQLGEI
jgi:hypothetical protein